MNLAGKTYGKGRVLRLDRGGGDWREARELTVQAVMEGASGRALPAPTTPPRSARAR